MLGLKTLMIECPNCYSGRTLKPDEKESYSRLPLKEFFNTKPSIQCSCGNEYTFLEGIVQDLISSNTFSEWGFVSDIYLCDEIEITVGLVKKIQLPQTIPIINKVFLTGIGGFALIAPQYNEVNCDIIHVISSEYPRSPGSPRSPGASGPPRFRVGDKMKITWCIYGNSTNHNIPAWRKIVIQAKREFINKQYSLALLTSAIAFESFIDTLLNETLINKGVPQESASTIVESINSIKTKVHSLLKSLDSVSFKDCDANKSWEKLLLQRNKIAHGEVIDVSEEDARNALKTVVTGILYISCRTSVLVLTP